MKIPFYELEIELDIEGIVEILSFELVERFNDHACVRLKCLIEEDSFNDIVLFTSAHSMMGVYEEKKILFYGYLLAVRTQVDRGKWVLKLEYISKTHDLDIQKRSRVFNKQDDLYINVINKTLCFYPGMQVKDEITNGKKMPGVLLQYEETDWEFLKRLASHFATFIISDSASEIGRIYIGVPDINNGVVIDNMDYDIVQNMDQYYHHTNIMKQEYICWRIKSRYNLQLGEEIVFNNIPSIIVAIHIYEEYGEVIREYTLHRKAGLFTEFQINYEILGLSLPATVINRKNNQVQVEFDINSLYESEQPSEYFVYGIESSSFYCMPEIGSRVHIYFPNKYESKAMAVHALNVGSGSGRNPSNKSFSSPAGAAMQLTPSHYEFKSDTSGASVLNLGADGNIEIVGTSILLDAATSICIGEGGKKPTPEIIVTAKNEESIKAGGGTSLTSINNDTTVSSDKVTIKAQSGDMSAEASNIKESVECSDEQLIKNYNNEQTSKIKKVTGAASATSAAGAVDIGDISNVALETASNLTPVNENIASTSEDAAKTSDKSLTIATPLKSGNTKDIISERDRALNRPRFYNTNPNNTLDENYNEVNKLVPSTSKQLYKTWDIYNDAAIKLNGPENDKIVASGNVLHGQLDATAYAGLWKKEKDGTRSFRPGIGGAVNAGASAVDVDVNYYAFGKENQMFNLGAGGKVSCLKAGASASGGIGMDNEGDWRLGASGEAGLYLVEAEVKGTATLVGIDATAKASGKVGFGVEGAIGLDDGVLKAKVGAAVLVGGSVSVELDFKDCAKMVAGWWENLWN